MGRAERARESVSLLAVFVRGIVDRAAVVVSRNSVLSLSTDLTKLADELKIAAPNYFLNVPTLLERVRRTIEDTIQKRGKFAATVFSKAQRRVFQRSNGQRGITDSFWLGLANRFMFPTIRTGIGPNLKGVNLRLGAAGAGNAAFFYDAGDSGFAGLRPDGNHGDLHHGRSRHRVVPGCVGVAMPGTEMKISDAGEILVRGPHIFPGYWKRPEETAKALEGGWFHTGDQGEVDATGNWRITGRLKNLIILNSGHNVAPEPLESGTGASFARSRTGGLGRQPAKFSGSAGDGEFR